MIRNLLRRPKDVVVLLLFGTLLGLSVYLLFFRKPYQVEEAISDTLDMIRQRDTLLAITDNSSTSYFLYKGQPLGYQYEMLTHFAKHLGVKLKIITVSNIEESLLRLTAAEADLIAMDLTVTAPRSDIIAFSAPLSETKQVLVQRKTEGFRKKRKNDVDPGLLQKPTDLTGKTIYVQKNSSHRLRLRNIANETGVVINIVETDQDTEELIAMVAEGEIDYTVADDHVAMANSTWYDNIDISMELSLPQDVAWALKPGGGSDSLMVELNNWIAGFVNTKTYRQIYRKYFVSKKSAHLKDIAYHTGKGGKLSKYDDLIRKHSKDGPWDWRLVASLIYEESRFNPNARSWAGAYGLMQLMPGTARRFGVKNITKPEEQIKGGIRLLNYLNEKLPPDINDPNERAKYILACYNIGMSHIIDAYNLALKYGEDPSKWEIGEKYLLLKSKPQYFNDPVVKSGYARGRETRRFVAKVHARYQDYLNTLPE
ncbi:MAG: transporter substrate-binding domain-containing protein [Bacteroidales bacterium]